MNRININWYKIFPKSYSFSPLYSSQLYRRFTLSSAVMEEAKDEIKKNPYYSKYAKKFDNLIQNSPDNFLNRVNKLKSENELVSTQKFTKAAEKGKPEVSSSVGKGTKKNLQSIMKVELLQKHTPEEISYIWTQHFMDQSAISGTMPAPLYDQMQERANKYPMFLFPLPRDDGYEFIYAQFSGDEVHMTSLINYQVHKENAVECLTITHYPDLKEAKGIVLIHGEVNSEMITTKEAQFLANQISLFYGGDDPAKLKLLETFHNRPGEFRHTDLIEQLENFDLGSVGRCSKS